MIPVSDAFKAAWANKTWARYGWRVRVKRLFWNGAAYVHEAAWIALRADQVAQVSPIPQQVDSEFESVFLISEFAIVVQSERNEWLESAAPPSFFAADGTAPGGYLAAGSLFEVSSVLGLQNDTLEQCVMFTGLLKEAPKPTSGRTTVSLSIISMAHQLVRSDGTKVSTPVVLENCVPPAGNGVTLEFKTTSRGVAVVSDLQKATVSMVRGREGEYVIDGLNEDLPALLTVNNIPGVSAPPATGATMKWSGRTWKQNIKIEDLAALVLNEAAIDASKREIEPILFPGGLSGLRRIDTQAEWETAATKVNADTISVPGSVRVDWRLVDDFGDGNFTADPVWTPISNVSIAVVGGKLQIGNGDELYTPFDGAVGTWEVKLSASGTNPFMFDFIRTAAGGAYSIMLSNGFLALLKNRDVGAPLASKGFAYGTEKTYRITRDAAGLMNLYVNGTLELTATDTAHNESARIQIRSGVSSAQVATIDDIFWSPYVDPTGAFAEIAELTFIYNLLSPPSAMGVLSVLQDLNGGSVLVKTAGAVDSAGSPGAFDILVERDSLDVMQHVPKQWLKIYLKITAVGKQSPLVHRIVANFSTADIYISIANLAGLDGWGALQKYVPPSGAVMGFRGNGNFFLRNRGTATPIVAELDQSNCLIEMLEFDPGDERVRTVGRVTYGGYISEYDCAAAGHAAPTAEQRYGRVVATEELTGTLYANDVDLGGARSRNLFERRYRRKRRGRFRCWIVPWLEVLDRVRITFARDPLPGRAVVGDSLLDRPGYARRQTTNESALSFAHRVPCEILAWTPDVMRPNQCVLYVEEILDD